MSEAGISRRRLIQGAAGIAVILVATKGGQILLTANPSGKDGPGSVEYLGVHEADTLRQVVKRLFPYQGLGDQPYRVVVNSVQSLSEITHVLLEGVAALDAAAKSTTWLKLAGEPQVAALKGIESNEFFRLMLNASIHGLHANQELWGLIGYQGSSVEHGGYINRGFNDIDWLP